MKANLLFRFLLLFLGIFIYGVSFGQQKFTLSGYISDKSTGEELIDAKIVVPKLSLGAYTNEFGFYSISLPAGSYEIDFRYSGYNTISQTIELTKDLKLNIALEMNEKVQ